MEGHRSRIRTPLEELERSIMRAGADPPLEDHKSEDSFEEDKSEQEDTIDRWLDSLEGRFDLDHCYLLEQDFEAFVRKWFSWTYHPDGHGMTVVPKMGNPNEPVSSRDEEYLRSKRFVLYFYGPYDSSTDA